MLQQRRPFWWSMMIRISGFCSAIDWIQLDSVVETADGQEAVDRATTAGLAGVLLDLDLPKLDSVGVLQWITQHVPQLPVVIMSAFSHKRQEMLANGAQAYFTKPLDLPRFTTVLASLFGARIGQVTA
jgi:CheY-like chemotaxis protein